LPILRRYSRNAIVTSVILCSPLLCLATLQRSTDDLLRQFTPPLETLSSIGLGFR
jgi:hypothetical protein